MNSIRATEISVLKRDNVALRAENARLLEEVLKLRAILQAKAVAESLK